MKSLTPVDFLIPILGLIFTAALLGSGFRPLAEGCLAGGALASADWLLLRVLYDRLASKGKGLSPRKIVSAAILGIKFIFLAFFIYLIINKLNFNPYGVAMGVGSLPLGITAGALISTRGENNDA